MNTASFEIAGYSPVQFFGYGASLICVFVGLFVLSFQATRSLVIAVIVRICFICSALALCRIMAAALRAVFDSNPFSSRDCSSRECCRITAFVDALVPEPGNWLSVHTWLDTDLGSLVISATEIPQTTVPLRHATGGGR